MFLKLADGQHVSREKDSDFDGRIDYCARFDEADRLKAIRQDTSGDGRSFINNKPVPQDRLFKKLKEMIGGRKTGWWW
ncbi:MAG: hypothetical protein ACLFS7_07150 [Desulfosudaceae bacterium]